MNASLGLTLALEVQAATLPLVPHRSGSHLQRGSVQWCRCGAQCRVRWRQEGGQGAEEGDRPYNRQGWREVSKMPKGWKLRTGG